MSSAGTPEELKKAVLKDLNHHASEISQARDSVEACVARSGTEDELRRATAILATAVSSYKQAAKTCRNLSAKPKAKAKAAPGTA